MTFRDGNSFFLLLVIYLLKKLAIVPNKATLAEILQKSPFMGLKRPVRGTIRIRTLYDIKKVVKSLVPTQVPYQREVAVSYALQWALQSNPAYYDYSRIGGDCTNFASQVLFAGAKVMNYAPLYGWYYIDPNRKSPSWTGVNYLRNFLVQNTTKGPFAAEVGLADLQPGDLIQLSFGGGGNFEHTLPITQIMLPVSPSNIYVSTHSPKKLNAKLSSYTYAQIRFLHIKGVYV